MDIAGGQILILSGSPGSGKTTTAERLARLPGTKNVHLHTDDFWGYIKQGHIDPWLPEADAQNHMVMNIAARVAALYAAEGYFVALDGVIRPWALHYYDATIPTHYMVLRVSAAEAVARCLARGGDSLTDSTVVAALHEEFLGLGPHEKNVVRADRLDPDQTLEAVIAALQAGSHRVH